MNSGDGDAHQQKEHQSPYRRQQEVSSSSNSSYGRGAMTTDESVNDSELFDDSMDSMLEDQYEENEGKKMVSKGGVEDSAAAGGGRIDHGILSHRRFPSGERVGGHHECRSRPSASAGCNGGQLSYDEDDDGGFDQEMSPLGTRHQSMLMQQQQRRQRAAAMAAPAGGTSSGEPAAGVVCRCLTRRTRLLHATKIPPAPGRVFSAMASPVRPAGRGQRRGTPRDQSNSSLTHPSLGRSDSYRGLRRTALRSALLIEVVPTAAIPSRWRGGKAGPSP